MPHWKRYATVNGLWGFKNPYLVFPSQFSLSACCHSPARMVRTSPSEPVSKPTVKCVLSQVALVIVSLHRNRKVTMTVLVCCQWKQPVLLREKDQISSTGRFLQRTKSHRVLLQAVEKRCRGVAICRCGTVPCTRLPHMHTSSR